ncbi:MAG: FecR domain-containing protein [Acidobacteriota bacterium]|nr:FecR domain-containing protein [Acidobacteriota bacterium]
MSALLAPLLALAGSPRFARAGEIDGSVDLQIRAADSWESALRNTPLIESSWVRTGWARTGQISRIEIELDDGSALRLTGDALAELSDYSRLSTGQLITLISLDHGVAYFTGEPKPHDVLTIAVPGGQVTLRQGSRLRFDASENASQIAVLEGAVRLSTAAAEMDLREGQIVQLGAGAPGRFALGREIPALDSDRWSEDRDKALAPSSSLKFARQVRYGLIDLDRNGAWIQTGDYGPVWKPKVAAAWAPFQDGKWQWYDGIGYTWISAESWGWMPYHHGRWMQDGNLGWIWSPGQSAIFKPGDVYWMRGTNLAGWGPLAIDENWTGAGTPRLYAAVNTTFAKFQPGLREIDPAALAAKPKDVLAAAVFALALPSPPLVAARLEAVRPVLRAGSTRVVPFVVGESYEARSEAPTVPERAAQPPTVPTEPLADSRAEMRRVANEPPLTGSLDNPAYVTEPEPDSFYLAPVYTGIVIVNPPERGRKHDRSPARENRPVQSVFQPSVKRIPREHPGESREPAPTEGGTAAEEKPSTPPPGKRGR